jgi:hypothetical protein
MWFMGSFKKLRETSSKNRGKAALVIELLSGFYQNTSVKKQQE